MGERRDAPGGRGRRPLAVGGDILDDVERSRAAPRYPRRNATLGLVVEDRASGFCGDVIAATAESVTLRDRHGVQRHFRWRDGGFLLEGRAVTLVRPAGAARPAARSNSGSVPGARMPARVAVASRIWVEGRHDAELVEHVWGDDLRGAGIVVEPMHGIDELPALVAAFQPAAQRRLGVLVDHLVAGSKEDRLARQVDGEHVLVTGHPFVDVWEGIRPEVVGITAWPSVSRGTSWKEGVAAALGVPVDGLWPRLRNRVRTYADLRPELVGAVERLIDFVAA